MFDTSDNTVDLHVAKASVSLIYQQDMAKPVGQAGVGGMIRPPALDRRAKKSTSLLYGRIQMGRHVKE